MRRIAAIVALGLVACSSSSGGGSAASTTTAAVVTTTTSTTAATTTTTAPEDAVKAAYLAYWKMVDRLAAAPDPTDPEIPMRTAEPLLSALKDQMTTRQSEGRTTKAPPGSKYQHHIRDVAITDNEATVSDCFVDDRVQFGPDGSVLNNNVSTVDANSTLAFADGSWKATDVSTAKKGDGDLGCDA